MSELTSIANFTVSNNCARVSWTPTGGALTSSLYDMIAELGPHWIRCYLSWVQFKCGFLERFDHLAASKRTEVSSPFP